MVPPTYTRKTFSTLSLYEVNRENRQKGHNYKPHEYNKPLQRPACKRRNMGASAHFAGHSVCRTLHAFLDSLPYCHYSADTPHFKSGPFAA